MKVRLAGLRFYSHEVLSRNREVQATERIHETMAVRGAP
jgi:hypothetical protein